MTGEYPNFTDDVYGATRSIEDERAHRKRMAAIGYRIFGSMRWGQIGDGHVSARDPELTDHFWLLDYGVPFSQATVDKMVLVGPDGNLVEFDGSHGVGANTAGYNIHYPVFQARPDVVSIAHTHTPYGTPWSANVKPFQPINQESTAFVFDQSLFDDEEVEVLSVDGGHRIAAAAGSSRLCILRNHGLVTMGATVEETVGFFVMAERVAEVHVKAPNAIPISEEGAKIAASTMAQPHNGWRVFHWLMRDIVPDPSVVD